MNFYRIGKKQMALLALVVGMLVLGLILLPQRSDFQPLDLEKAPALEKAIEENRFLQTLSPEEIEEQLNPLLYSYQEFNEVDPEKIRLDPRPRSSSIKPEEARQDIEFLFSVLRYGYAGYKLQGGEDYFIPARDNLMEYLTTYSSGAEIEVSNLEEKLIEQLSFINDGHFSIASNSFLEYHHLHYSEQWDFYRDEQGFFLQEEGQKLYLEACNNQDPEKYLRLSLNQAGELIYRPMAMTPVSSPYQVELLLKGDDRSLTRDIYLYPVKSNSFDSHAYFYYEKEDIPIVESRSLGTGREQELSLFLDKARQLSTEEIVILDIRGNSGGSDWYPRQWIQNYTSSSVTPGVAQGAIDLRTRTSQALQLHFREEGVGVYDTLEQRFAPREGGWSELRFYEPVEIQNQGYLIVLVDYNTASAAESFVRSLRQVENVIIIGSNTRGATTAGNVVPFSLPASGIEVKFGVTLFPELDFSSREGRGQLPDIFVPPEKALQLAFKFIESYLR